MSAKRAARPAKNPFLDQLSRALQALSAEAHPSELAEQVVRTVAGQKGMAGARLWRVGEGPPVVWSESGRVPAADPQLAEKALAGGTSTVQGHHWASVLGRNSEMLGLLEAYGTGPIDQQAQDVLSLLGSFADVALTSSKRAQVIAELSTIVESTKKLNSTLDLGELINIILQLATRQTGADRGTVFLVDHEHNEIWSLVGLGLAQQEIRLPATKGIAGWVASHGETVNLEDVYADPRFEAEVDRRLGYRTKTLLCLPIRNKDGEIVGVLQLLNKRAGPFSRQDEGFLLALSDHVALALENAQLHRERLAKQKMERDLALARSIQISLLPENPPELDGFEIAVLHKPSLMVGGDYYDFVTLDPDTLLAVVADVEGKGVSSAMVMANLQATLRALVAHLHSLERLVGSLNDMIWADTRAQKYLTMFIALLDQRHKSLHYINAGHVPPAVVRANGDTAYLREGGMVVGMFPSVTYERGHIRLEPGDIVVSCTDGITEAMDAQSNEFGLERLVETVRRNRTGSAREIVELVMAEVDRYSRGGTHEDDRVIFILKVL
jgi:sigma-B regulation protein RsbU (phosphoserine phosphatase)